MAKHDWRVRVPVAAVAAVGLGAFVAACDSHAAGSSGRPSAVAPASSVRQAAATGSAGTAAATSAPVSGGSCAASPRPSAPGNEVFRARWSDTFSGSVASIDVTDRTVYVACEDGPAKRIAAVSIADGTTRWVATVTPHGDWNGGFAVAATRAGALTSFHDAAGAHLVLLDAGSGAVTWTDRIDEPAYDLGGEVAPGLAVVNLTEDDQQLLDLATGQLRPADDALGVAGDRFVTDDGTTLTVGANPFDPAAPGTSVRLTTGANDVTGAGDLVVVAEGDEVVGIVGGSERWRVDAGVGAVGTVELLGRYVVAEADSTDPSEPDPVAVIALDPAPHVTGRLPQYLDTNSMGGFDLRPNPVVVGMIDPTPGGSSNEEVDQLVAVTLTADGPRVTASVPVNALSLMSASPTTDHFVWIDAGHLHALSVPGLHDDAGIDVGGDASVRASASGHGVALVDDHTLTWCT